MNADECDVVILTESRFEQVGTESPKNPEKPGGDAKDTAWYSGQVLLEDALLERALQARGLRTRRLAWSNPELDRLRPRAAVVRSTWDYFDRFAEFSAWLDRSAPRLKFMNSAATIRRNWNKFYLAELAAAGVRIPPTRFLPQGTSTTLEAEFAALGLPQAILKPAVSGAARHTYRLNAGNLHSHAEIFRHLLENESLLLQAFLDNVLTDGEISLILIGGKYAHAVRKTAKPGDFRVQDDHGGTAALHLATPEEIACAETIVAAWGEPCAYARVDLVRDAAGLLSLMELELIEPELFFRFRPESAEELADVIVRETELEFSRNGGESGSPKVDG